MMKLAALFSGGKDSAYAMDIAMDKGHEIVCLITVISENKESYMFHTPNIDLCDLQAEAIGIPVIKRITEGQKEAELDDLKEAIRKAISSYGIQGVVTGAILSVYQASRIQKICQELGIWCFNPLWQKDQIKLLEELVEKRYDVLISGIAAYPFDSSWLGRRLDEKMISELAALNKKYSINPAGEGGELESFVCDAPFFRKKIIVKTSRKDCKGNSGVFVIEEAFLSEK